MHIAIDILPLQSGHKVRGVGFYLKNLLSSLHEYFPEHTYYEFVKGDKLPKDIDLIHYPYFDLFSLTLPLKFQKPTIVTVHDLIPIKFPEQFPKGYKGELKWQIQKKLVKKASAILTNSESSQKDIHEILKIPLKDIHVVYHGAGKEFKKIVITEAKRKEICQKYDLPDKFILYVGDVTANKNLPVLLKAVAIVKTPIVLVGKSLASTDFDATNLWNKDLISVQKEAKDNKDLHILGFVPTDDLVTLYNMASVFVLPSIYEGFGLPLLEAMSCGAAVVTTKLSSLPEVGGDAPIYVDHNNPHEFAKAIISIMENKNIKSERSQKSLLRAENFSWQKTAANTVDVYKEILKI